MNLKIMLILLLTISIFSNPYSTEELVAVSITGAKINPGTYRVSPDQRVLDVIKMANNGIIPPLDTIDSRQIIITNSYNTKDTIDILKYINSGDLSQNPYVTGGNSIHINFATEWVFISGDIQGVLTGNTPLKKGETLSEMLSLYTTNTTADLEKILFERVGEKSIEKSLKELSSTKLENLDVITIFPLKERKDSYRVTISGEVQRPGIYTIKHGKTLASELIKKSGGATDLGNIEKAWIIRKGKLAKIPLEKLEAGMLSIKKELKYSITNSMASGDYLIIPLNSENITLEKGDEIVIPKIENIIYISGLVKKPGGYPYFKDKDILYYIEKTGGFTKDANVKSIKIVEMYGDVYRTTVKDTVASGDMIIVSERDKERETRFIMDVIKTTATVLTAVVTIITFSISLSNSK